MGQELQEKVQKMQALEAKKARQVKALEAGCSLKIQALEAEQARTMAEKEAELERAKAKSLQTLLRKSIAEAPNHLVDDDAMSSDEKYRIDGPKIWSQIQRLSPAKGVAPRRRLTGSEVAASAPHRRLVVLEKLLEDIKSANRNRDH